MKKVFPVKTGETKLAKNIKCKNQESGPFLIFGPRLLLPCPFLQKILIWAGWRQ